jgi:hypothetical protein
MQNYFGFLDESGVLDAPNTQQPFFGVGFLKILDSGEITEKLMQSNYDYFSVQKEARRNLLKSLELSPKTLNRAEINLLLASTSHREYKFTSITHTTLQRYKAFIDAAFQFPLHFCALVIDKSDPLFNMKLYKNYWSAYIKYSQLVCAKNIAKEERLCVIADYMNRPSNTETFFESKINEVPSVFNTLRAHSETFIFIQLCDLLLGSVLFQWRQMRGQIQNSNRAAAKMEFVRYLISKLNVPAGKQTRFPLAQAVTCKSPLYFSVWPLRLSKTK